MSRLAKALSGGRSQDIIADAAVATMPVAKDNLEEEVKTKSGPVKTKLDLSLFDAFGADEQSKQGCHRALWAKVDAKGNIIFTDAFSRKFAEGARVMIYLNPKGNIMGVGLFRLGAGNLEGFGYRGF